MPSPELTCSLAASYLPRAGILLPLVSPAVCTHIPQERLDAAAEALATVFAVLAFRVRATLEGCCLEVGLNSLRSPESWHIVSD